MSVIVTHCSPSRRLKLAAVMETLWRQTEDEDEGGGEEDQQVQLVESLAWILWSS